MPVGLLLREPVRDVEPVDEDLDVELCIDELLRAVEAELRDADAEAADDLGVDLDVDLF